MVLLVHGFKTRELIDEAMAMADAEPIVAVQTNTTAGILELVRRTGMASILADSALQNCPDLFVVPLQDPTPLRTPGLMWKRGAMRMPAIRLFADLVRSAVETRMTK